METVNSSTRILVERLHNLVGELFRAAGLPNEDARLCAHTIVLQEMRGVSTHGLRRLAPNLEGLQSGRMSAAPQRRVLRDGGAMAVLDGDHGVGMIGCMAAMDVAIEKAKQFGIGFCVVINNNHFQSAAPYCLRAVEAEMIGIAMSNTQASMGYPGASTRVIGNGPFGFAAPAQEFPIVFDSSLSTSGGLLEKLIREGKPIAGALAGLDEQGQVTTDPKKVLHGGVPLPIGGHKGAGLALMIEMLTGVLGGGAFLAQIVPPEKRSAKENAESQTCIALNIAHFMESAQFRMRTSAFIADLKNNPLAPGHNEILVPGERGHKASQEALRKGVLLGADIQSELQRWSTTLNVECSL